MKKKGGQIDPLGGQDGITILRGLVHEMRVKFYPETIGQGANEKPFYSDLRLLRQVATWPARFLSENGKRIGGDRYREIMRKVIVEAAVFGMAPEKLRSRAGYLMSCVQSHWRMHADEYFEEGKVFDDALQRELRNVRARGESEPVSAVDVLAKAALELQKPRKGRTAKPKEPQLELF